MKKLLCVLLIAVLLLPSAVMAEETDPIIGCWYIFYDKAIAPEMASAFSGSDIALSVYQFSSSGIVYAINAQVIGTDGTADYSSAGKWVKNDSDYTVSIIGIGECPSFVQDDSLYLQIPGVDSFFMKLKKLYPFDPYKDYIRK